MASTSSPSMRRFVLLAATVRATSAALALPSVLTTRGHNSTLATANNCAIMLETLNRYEEASSLMRKTVPVARRVLGEGHTVTLRSRWVFALALYRNDGATLDDLREAVETLESLTPLWTRVFGASHPETPKMQRALKEAEARHALASRRDA